MSSRTYLAGCVEVGTSLQQLKDDVIPSFFCGQMQRRQSVLQRSIGLISKQLILRAFVHHAVSLCLSVSLTFVIVLVLDIHWKHSKIMKPTYFGRRDDKN